MTVRWAVRNGGIYPHLYPKRKHTCCLKIARIIFFCLDAYSENEPNGKTQSPSDLYNFVTLNWDGVCDGGGGSFII